MSVLSFLAFALLLYFLPAIVAGFFRRHHNRLAIFILNTFLGWTFIGWVAALIWACTYTAGIPSRSRFERGIDGIHARLNEPGPWRSKLPSEEPAAPAE